MEDMQRKDNNVKLMRVLSITGGKGGVGKTTLSVNLAVAFAKMKKKVLLFDADLGLANIDVLLGLKPEKTIHDFLSGTCSLEDLCIEGPHGIKIIPSSSGVQEMADLSSAASLELVRSFSSLKDTIDMMLIDMASGISNQVMDITHASQDVLVVICNDPSSLMDAYATIKILHQKYGRSRFGIVVNKVKNSYEGHTVFEKFQATAAKFINISLQYLGFVPNDDFINIAARDRISVIDQFPFADATHAIKNVCHGIDNWTDDSSLAGGIHFFFERLIQGHTVT